MFVKITGLDLFSNSFRQKTWFPSTIDFKTFKFKPKLFTGKVNLIEDPILKTLKSPFKYLDLNPKFNEEASYLGLIFNNKQVK